MSTRKKQRIDGYCNEIAFVMVYRNSVLKIRGLTCEKCGKMFSKRSSLDMHHKDRQRWNNTKDNVVLLCKRCHNEEHSLNKSFISSKSKQEAKRPLKTEGKNHEKAKN